MKKIILVAVFAMLTVLGAFAQDFDENNGKTYCEPMQNMRFGYAGVLGASSNLVGGFDFGFNIFELGVRPYNGGRISLGADFQIDVINAADGYYFSSASHKTNVVPATADFNMLDVKNARFDLISFAFPLEFSQKFGDKVEFTIGASAKINLNADTYVRYKNATGDYCTLTVEGIRTRRLTYDIHLAITYDDFGVYASYTPMGAFTQEFGPAFSFFTVGAIFRIDE